LQGNLSQKRAEISVNASSLESRSQRRRLTFSRLIEPLGNLSQERADISITAIVHHGAMVNRYMERIEN
jgi:hypothetical protein